MCFIIIIIIMLSALCSLPPCLDQIQTVHYHYLIYWIYLLLQISINYSFLLTHQWHSKKLPNIFNQHFRYASEVHTYNTRYASKSDFYKPRSRTNIGKQTTAAMATELWQQLPTHIKNLST